MDIEQAYNNVHSLDADLWEFIKYLLVLGVVIIGYFAKDAVSTLRNIQQDIAIMKVQSAHTSSSVDDIKKDVSSLKETAKNHDERIREVEKILHK